MVGRGPYGPTDAQVVTLLIDQILVILRAHLCTTSHVNVKFYLHCCHLASVPEECFHQIVLSSMNITNLSHRIPSFSISQLQGDLQRATHVLHRSDRVDLSQYLPWVPLLHCFSFFSTEQSNLECLLPRMKSRDCSDECRNESDESTAVQCSEPPGWTPVGTNILQVSIPPRRTIALPKFPLSLHFF